MRGCNPSTREGERGQGQLWLESQPTLHETLYQKNKSDKDVGKGWTQSPGPLGNSSCLPGFHARQQNAKAKTKFSNILEQPATRAPRKEESHKQGQAELVPNALTTGSCPCFSVAFEAAT